MFGKNAGKWKRSVDEGKVFVALITDLSKAFDCLDYELFIAKLNACAFSLPASRLIGSSFSDWFKVILRIPQRLILGALLMI